MPAADKFHAAVRNALIKDGWTITEEPLRLRYEEHKVFIDIGAERLLAAEKGAEKIAVEVKVFGGPSPLTDLERTLGQLDIYGDLLELIEPERILYLAISQSVADRVFTSGIPALMLRRRISHLLTFDPQEETITAWNPHKTE